MHNACVNILLSIFKIIEGFMKPLYITFPSPPGATDLSLLFFESVVLSYNC